MFGTIFEKSSNMKNKLGTEKNWFSAIYGILLTQ